MRSLPPLATANVSTIAHLTDGGDPTVPLFANDTATIHAGNARVTEGPPRPAHDPA